MQTQPGKHPRIPGTACGTHDNVMCSPKDLGSPAPLTMWVLVPSVSLLAWLSPQLQLFSADKSIS